MEEKGRNRRVGDKTEVWKNIRISKELIDVWSSNDLWNFGRDDQNPNLLRIMCVQ